MCKNRHPCALPVCGCWMALLNKVLAKRGVCTKRNKICFKHTGKNGEIAICFSSKQAKTGIKVRDSPHSGEC